MKPITNIIIATSVLAGSLFAQSSVTELRHQLISVDGASAVTPVMFQENTMLPKKKSQALAVVYSLALPGMGELYADGFDNGKYSLTAEATLWLTYISFYQYGSWMQSDARSLVTVHAGASSGGKDDQFFVNAANFSNVYDYNDKKLRDRALDEVYDPSQGYYWSWDSDANRQRFRALRISSDKVFNNSRFVIGAIIVNHIVSALNAARLVRHFNRNAEGAVGAWYVEPNRLSGLGRIDGMRLTYAYRF